MILDNGVIHTLDPSMATARALAIAGERVAGGVGTHETALASPERVDLGGRCVVPGFNDAHVHFPTWAAAQREVRLEGTASSRKPWPASATRSGPSSPAAGCGAGAGEAVTGRRRWSRLVRRSTPSRETRRRRSWPATTTRCGSTRPLWRRRTATCRSEGGVVEVDERGEPTGVLREESAWTFRDRYLRPTDDEFIEAMRDGLKLAAARGVTALHDKDGWLGAPRLWQRLLDDGLLTLRVWQSLPAEHLDEIDALALPAGIGGDLLRIGYLKVFMDGTLGSQTARLLDGSGVEITSRDELAEIVRRGARSGWPVAVHAIGDAANRDALDAFEETREEWRGLRPRIEHAQLLAEEDVPRFAELGVAASVQFSHAPSDRDIADRLWAGMTDRAYAYRSLLDSGALLANGSDAPIEELDPLAGIRAGVLRTLDEREGWHPEQAVTVQQALAATTVNPAWLAGDERRRGKLVPGYLADLVVLDRDLLACPPEELPEVQVVATMLGGRWVHNPPPWD